jgi:phospholipid/cholesterol/gamma-HCH transport system ATP-binding protein
MSANEAAIRFEQVSKSFGSKRVLQDVSFDIARGSAFCILGRSGTGKSVTLKLMIGLLKPEQGRIFVEHQEITALHARDCRRFARQWVFFSKMPRSSILFP